MLVGGGVVTGGSGTGGSATGGTAVRTREVTGALWPAGPKKERTDRSYSVPGDSPVQVYDVALAGRSPGIGTPSRSTRKPVSVPRVVGGLQTRVKLRPSGVALPLVSVGGPGTKDGSGSVTDAVAAGPSPPRL